MGSPTTESVPGMATKRIRPEVWMLVRPGRRWLVSAETSDAARRERVEGMAPARERFPRPVLRRVRSRGRPGRSPSAFRPCPLHRPRFDRENDTRTAQAPSCDTRAEVDLPHTQSSSHLRPGLIGTPPVAVVGEQCMNTGCRSPDLARRHGRCFPGRSDGEHPPPLRAIRSSVRALYALGNAAATRA